MPRVLLFGSGGQLGRELVKALAPKLEMIPLSRREADLSNPSSISHAVRAARPDLVINAAAYTAVDRAESEPEFAHAINAAAPGVIAGECRSVGACLIHFSTDYVFDGSGNTPWKETGTPRPINIYGQTKLEGEQRIAQSGCRHLIFRSSWIYASHGSNFLLTMLRLAREKHRLTIVDDQLGCPTSAKEIARGVSEILDKYATGRLAESDFGAYHMACSGSTSWFGFARAIFARVALDGPAPEIVPVPSEQYPTPARRPRNSVLDCSKLYNSFGVRLANWEDALDAVVAELQPVS